MKHKATSPYFYGTVLLGVCGLGAVCSALSILLTTDTETATLNSKTPQEINAMADLILQDKCANCHAADAKANSDLNYLTFGLMNRHVQDAQRAWVLGGDPSIRKNFVDQLKLYRTLERQNMPPTSYSLVHWGSRLTPTDTKILARAYKLPEAPGKNVAIFPIEEAPVPSAEQAAKIELGRLLYHDPRLSTNNEISCSSCHDLTKAGTDNKAKSEGVPGADGKPQLGGVNAPTVFNAANHICQFWDGRAKDLKEQAGGPPLNPVEMGYAKPEDWNDIVAKLQQDQDIVMRFAAVFGDRGMSGDTITEAIAAFEETLVTPGSPFDSYLLGDEDALTDNEKAGWKTFMAHGCATCHSGSAMGGGSFENINTFANLRDLAAPADYQEAAYGRRDFTKDEKHKDLFRVPTLRNVALTAPYFHTGTVTDLADAVRIMFATQSDSPATEQNIADVTAFLKTLTGRYNGKSLDELKPEDVVPSQYLNKTQH